MRAIRMQLRERLAALRLLSPFVKRVWETWPACTVAVLLLRVLQACLPVALLWVGKLIVDTVVNGLDGGAVEPELLSLLVLLELGLALVAEALQRATVVLESMLGDVFANQMSVRLMRHAALLDLERFEDPEFQDRLERARRQIVGNITLLGQAVGMVQAGLTLAVLLAALFAFNAWLAVLLMVSMVPAFVGETTFARLSYSLLFRWTAERRQLDYLRHTATSSITAKEVKLFALADHLAGRYDRLAMRLYEENRRLEIRRAIIGGMLSGFSTAVYYGAYAFIIWQTVRGRLTVGSLTFLATAFQRSRDVLARILLGAADLYEQSLFLRDLFDIFEMRPRLTAPTGAHPIPRTMQQGFRFEDVGFRYPGSDHWALRGVSFSLAPGERLALVGGNGAGKTTVVKLLTRLYDPTEGRILLDGVDLREYDLDALRAAIGVVFQDFVRYDMQARENIAVGRIDAMYDLQEIRQAARKSGADAVVAELEAGYEQMLGRRFDGGVDLSGGEWQKFALARAYIRNARILVLDEPTAALDARAEYDVFERFSELTAGRTTVLISHRFSTVRMADRILVLDAGKIVEEGSHGDLVARGGRYAELYALQAAGYR